MRQTGTYLLCLFGALHCLLILPVSQATSLTKVSKDKASNPAVSIDSEQAHDFLAHARLRRSADPNWHRKNPDFQSYYRYYSSIGHTEGLYEIDRLRMLYQRMRHLELTYGPDASKYQNALGLQLKSTPPPTTQPPPPTLPPVSKMDVMYLCNSKDPQCKPHIVYLPAGGVPVLCDPRYHPNCKLSPVQEHPSPPVTASEPVTSAPPPPQKSTPPPPPPPMIIKGMEYDCDPYWDPDCLIDNPPRPVKMIESQPVLPAEKLKKETGNKVILNDPVPTYDPYDFNQDLYDPFRHAAPAP
ncbi:actinodin3 [Megalobrama amblycephala]|uniref:actinodin3 n=1 Tax=Megalobrama amblycephala TaxID=75352 RepID=UPI002013DCD1|nr:actinodin3 [Megalobrama amblycephala]XP_048034236.1 actinodin3 [Megalobrama amblycephala]XP_048034241.1 actinodin3 [Megalobrama amblycephala]